jgi:hypothetical protein
MRVPSGSGNFSLKSTCTRRLATAATGLEAGFEMDVRLGNALESIGTSSRGVAQPGSAPALGAPPVPSNGSILSVPL